MSHSAVTTRNGLLTTSNASRVYGVVAQSNLLAVAISVGLLAGCIPCQLTMNCVESCNNTADCTLRTQQCLDGKCITPSSATAAASSVASASASSSAAAASSSSAASGTVSSAASSSGGLGTICMEAEDSVLTAPMQVGNTLGTPPAVYVFTDAEELGRAVFSFEMAAPSWVMVQARL